jgi:uncharacterized protein
MPATAFTPTAQGERILLLDSLRGIAVLGILFMNIPGFSDSLAAFHTPDLRDFNGANRYLWLTDTIVLEGSQRAIFSMLFGAGILLFISRAEKNHPGLMPAEYFFKRQLWLLLFALFNAYILMWFWDILFHYAIIGMMLFAFRRLSSKHLLLAAFICMMLQLTRENVNLYRDKAIISKGEAVMLIDTTKTPLTWMQKDELAAMQKLKEENTRESKLKKAEADIRAVQTSYATLYQHMSESSFRGETRGMFYFLFFDVLTFMFLGMAFFKSGILTGMHRMRTYMWMLVIGLGIGLPISYLRVSPDIYTYQFSYYEHVKGEPFDYYAISRTLRALGIFAGIMLLYKSGVFKWFFSLMRPVGQMAFTNYLMQSLMCGFIFYGIGLGYFGQLQRYETYLVVAGVWSLEIIWSHIWLSYFRFGPFEWLWRTLTYWKRQPIRKQLGNTLSPLAGETILLQKNKELV